MGGVASAVMRAGVVCFLIAFCAELASAAGFITVGLSGAAESIALTAGSATNAGSTSITATTSWSLGPPNTLHLDAYFASATAALTDGAGHNIPSSAFSITDSRAGSTSGTLSNTVDSFTANAGLMLENIDITPSNKTGTITDTLTFNINLSALSQLPAATYTGTLIIEGIALGPGHEDSGQHPIAVTATLAESLTVSLSGSSVSFTLAAGSATNAGSASITATTKWVLSPSRNAVGVYAFFTSALAALTDGSGHNIPSSAFKITDSSAGGISGTLINTVPFGAANAGLQLANVAITNANKNASRTDAMTFNINLSGGTLPQLPAATYTGTLNIEAQATP